MLKVQDCDEVNSVFEAVLAQIDDVPKQFKAVDFRRVVAKHALANKEHTAVSPLTFFMLCHFVCMIVTLSSFSTTPKFPPPPPHCLQALMKTKIDYHGYSYAEFCQELIDVTKPVPHLDLTGFLVRLVVGHPTVLVRSR